MSISLYLLYCFSIPIMSLTYNCNLILSTHKLVIPAFLYVHNNKFNSLCFAGVIHHSDPKNNISYSSWPPICNHSW